MPNNAKIIKDGEIIDNQWPIVDATIDTTIPEGNIILPLEAWQANKSSLKNRKVGLLLKNDQQLDEISDDLCTFNLIAIDFPVFMDGRGFSIARLLRDRYHFKGEIRATGHFIRDQLSYLKRSGFNAFDLDNDIDIQAALTSLDDFSDGYQTSADQHTPLFRRRG